MKWKKVFSICLICLEPFLTVANGWGSSLPKTADSLQDGIALLESSQFEEAIHIFDHLLQHNPQNARAFTERGKAHFLSNQSAKAVEDCQQAISLNPRNIKAMIILGNALGTLDQKKEAIQWYSHAIDTDPGNWMAYYNRANTYQDIEEFPQAFADFNKALSLNSSEPEIMNNLGTAYADSGNQERALSIFSKMIEKQPNFPAAYLNRAGIYLGMGELNLAIQDYNVLLGFFPHDSDIYNERGICRKKRKSLKLAQSDFQRSLQENPESPAPLTNLGHLAYDAGRREDAFRYYQSALEINSKFSPALVGRASIYKDMENLAKSWEDTNRALMYGEDSGEVWSALGNIYYLRKQYEPSILFYTKAIELDSSKQGFYHNRGCSYLDKKDYESALSDFKRSLELNPDDAEDQYNKGQCCEFTGRREEAIAAYENFVRLAPPHRASFKPVAEKKIRRLKWGDGIIAWWMDVFGL